VAAGDEGVETGGEGFSPAPQVRGEGDLLASVGLAVEQGPGWDLDAQHLLEAQSLSAELDFVAGVGVGVATLVLDREGAPKATDTIESDAFPVGCVRGAAMELNDVGCSGEAQAKGMETQRASDPQVATRLQLRQVGAFVEQLTFSGETIVGPQTFHVHQRTAAFAESQVPQP